MIDLQQSTYCTNVISHVGHLGSNFKAGFNLDAIPLALAEQILWSTLTVATKPLVDDAVLLQEVAWHHKSFFPAAAVDNTKFLINNSTS